MDSFVWLKLGVWGEKKEKKPNPLFEKKSEVPRARARRGGGGGVNRRTWRGMVEGKERRQGWQRNRKEREHGGH